MGEPLSMCPGVDVVVATPGRLLHLSGEETLSLDQVAYLVVDEADRFMQGSLEDELRKVCEHRFITHRHKHSRTHAHTHTHAHIFATFSKAVWITLLSIL